MKQRSRYRPATYCLIFSLALASCTHSMSTIDTGGKPNRVELVGGYSWQGGHYASGRLMFSSATSVFSCYSLATEVRVDSTTTVIPTFSIAVNYGVHIGLDIGYATDGKTGGPLLRPTIGCGYRAWQFYYGFTIAVPSVPCGLSRHYLTVTVPIITFARW